MSSLCAHVNSLVVAAPGALHCQQYLGPPVGQGLKRCAGVTYEVFGTFFESKKSQAPFLAQ